MTSEKSIQAHSSRISGLGVGPRAGLEAEGAEARKWVSEGVIGHRAQSWF